MSTSKHPKPQKPVEPDPLDCCGSGCARCIFDIYDDELQGYRRKLAVWERDQGRDDSSGNP